MDWLSDPRVLQWGSVVALPFIAVSWTLILVQFYRRRKARRAKRDGG